MLKNHFIHSLDQLVYQAVFGSDQEKQRARFEIWQRAIANKIIPSSLNDFYLAQGENKISRKFTTPALNLRGMTYDTARAIFAAAKKHQVGAFIFEIARSEMKYTAQSPQEYVSVIMAGALRENWSGPLFIQGDHFQAKASAPGQPQDGEIKAIKQSIIEAITAGFYNLDIDMSTLVDLGQKTEAEQQRPNIKHSLEMVELVRSLEPPGVTISLGAEIGHIGGKNSTLADFNAFMRGFNQGLKKDMTGISKISIQTGTHHGGVVMPDGSLADVKIDFEILKNVTSESRKKYHLGGSVQHGASTLPDAFFSKFVEAEVLEVHLATGLQNIQLDHPAFPQKLLEKMYIWLDETQAGEKKPGQTTNQFHYNLRKKVWGKFKSEIWNLPENIKTEIRATLENKFAFFFKELNVIDTQDLVGQFVKPVVIKKTLADFSI